MLMLEGECDKCGRFCTSGYDSYILDEDDNITELPVGHHNKLICFKCYYKYFSIESKREIEINKLLKTSLLEKLKNLLNI